MFPPSLRYVTLAALSLLLACTPERPVYNGTDLTGVPWGGDVELTAHTGNRLKLSVFAGKLVVLFFGYTHCPDICAPTLAKLALVLKHMGTDAERVQVVFISVDPAHDTPAQLAQFVSKFHPSFVGLTGSAAEIAAVTREYKVAYGENPGHSPTQTLIDHSGGMLVKDVGGKMRLLFKNDMTAEAMAQDLKTLLTDRR